MNGVPISANPVSEVEGPSTPLGVNGPESVLFVRSEVEGRYFFAKFTK